MRQEQTTETPAANSYIPASNRNSPTDRQIGSGQPLNVSDETAPETVADRAESTGGQFATVEAAGVATEPGWLARKRAKERNAQASKRWDEQTFVSLLANYQRANLNYLWVRVIWLLVSVIGVLPGILLSLLHVVSNPLWNQISGWAVILLGAATMAAAFLNKRAARALRRIRDPRAVQPLLRMLADDSYPGSFSDVKMRRQVKQAITPLLPGLREGEAVRIHDYDWQGLGKNLILTHAEKDEPFQTASLQAISRLGIMRLIPVVKQMAGAKAVTPAQARVQESARECLTSLHAREERASAPHTLMRPASITDLPGDALLRPLQGSAPTDPAQLLRPDAG